MLIYFVVYFSSYKVQNNFSYYVTIYNRHIKNTTYQSFYHLLKKKNP